MPTRIEKNVPLLPVVCSLPLATDGLILIIKEPSDPIFFILGVQT